MVSIIMVEVWHLKLMFWVVNIKKINKNYALNLKRIRNVSLDLKRPDVFKPEVFLQNT